MLAEGKANASPALTLRFFKEAGAAMDTSYNWKLSENCAPISLPDIFMVSMWNKNGLYNILKMTQNLGLSNKGWVHWEESNRDDTMFRLSKMSMLKIKWLPSNDFCKDIFKIIKLCGVIV